MPDTSVMGLTRSFGDAVVELERSLPPKRPAEEILAGYFNDPKKAAAAAILGASSRAREILKRATNAITYIAIWECGIDRDTAEEAMRGMEQIRTALFLGPVTEAQRVHGIPDVHERAVPVGEEG